MDTTVQNLGKSDRVVILIYNGQNLGKSDRVVILIVVERAKRAKPLSTLVEITPLPQFHKALLHTYKGPKSRKK